MNELHHNQPAARMTLITGMLLATIVTLTAVTILFASDTYFAHAEEPASNTANTDNNINTAAETLNKANTTTLNVSVYSIIDAGGTKDIQPVKTPSGESTIVLYRDQYIGFPPLATLIGYYKHSTIIQITGRSKPNAIVTLQFDAKSSSTKVTSADENGMWRIDLNIDELKPGDYTASIKTSVDDVVSDTAVIGTFSVGTKRIMSNTTWMSIMLIGSVIILALVIANIAVLVSHRRENRRASSLAARVA